MGIEDTLATHTQALTEIADSLASRKTIVRDKDGNVSHVETERQNSLIEAERRDAVELMIALINDFLGEKEMGRFRKHVKALISTGFHLE